MEQELFLKKAIFVIRQWSTRLVYSNNRFYLELYKTLMAVNAKRRAIVRVALQAFSGTATDPFDTHEELRILTRYRQEFSELPGWFLWEAQVAWDCLLCFQDKQDIRGNMLEIGVWRGKSAALSTLHARQDKTCAYIDREMSARGAEVTIWKSGRPTDSNCFGITDRVEMFEYRGPDWNPRLIEI